jgi:RNA polymerase sigma-70 factor (ECF subfamily)
VSTLRQSVVRELYEQHKRGLISYACSLVTSFSVAEDVVHQVFERLLRGDIELDGEPQPYLYRAVRNASLNALRSRSREVELPEDWLEGPAGLQETAIELQSVLRDLPQEQREIIVLRLWGEMSFEEAARALGISPNTAASRYRYGLAKLKEQFRAVRRV